MARLPSFVVIGAMKSGTSSLATYLGAHPGVTMSRPKEPNFFADPGNWDKGLDWYRELFPSDATIAGEATTRYTMSPLYVGAAERIHRIIPEARLIYLVRDPIERMRSMFVHQADKHQTSYRSLAEAIERDPTYLEISRYGTQVRPYLDLFEEGQILIFTTDELRDLPDAAMTRAFAHIGADPNVCVSTSRFYNRGDDKKHLGQTGFALAKLIEATGLKNLVAPGVRRKIKHWFSDDFSRRALEIDPSTERDLRTELGPDMAVIRDVALKSGAYIPPWLQDSNQVEDLSGRPVSPR